MSSSYHDNEDKNKKDEEVNTTSCTTSLQLNDTTESTENISNATEPPKQIGNVEHIEDDDDGPTLPPANMFDDSHTKMANVSANLDLEYVNELSPPTPFNIADFDDGDNAIAEKLAKEDMNRKPTAAIRQDIEENASSDNRRDGSDNRRGWGDIESRGDNSAEQPVQTRERGNIIGESSNNQPSIDQTDEMIQADITTTADMPLMEDEGEIDIHIPEAFLVDDISVYDERTIYEATPTLPWWKQKRVRLMVGVVFILLAALSIALGVTLSRPQPDRVMIQSAAGSNVPTISSAPSSSLVPSSSPTECVDKMISNKQTIDLKTLQIDDPRDPKVAVDGRNMVVVVKDEQYYTTNNGFDGWYVVYDGPVFVSFYTLDSDNWRRVQTESILVDNMEDSVEVEIFEETAFIAFRGANNYGRTVLVYEQNEFRDWKKADDPFIHSSNETHFSSGLSVDINGDLSCISDGNMGTSLFRREGNKWVQFDIIDGGERCSISGDTIAISKLVLYSPNVLQLYEYNRDLNEAVPIQDPIPANLMDLSSDYLAYWDKDQGAVFVYRRNESDQTYNFYQPLDISKSEQYNSLAIDNDILIVEGVNRTNIFSFQNDRWEESITLDQGYGSYQLSGRNLIATKENEVYAFNIQTCTQEAPTQTPSMSISPSAVPSTETCDRIQVSISTQTIQWEARWKIYRVDDVLVKSGTVTDEGGDNYVVSFCPQEGGYMFTIAGSGPNSSCSFGKGDYNITTESGVLIEGAKVSFAGSQVTWCDWEEQTPFSYVPGSSTTNIITRAPSPAATPFPTTPFPAESPPAKSLSTTTPTNAKPDVACLTRTECEEQLQNGYTNFYSGSYADYGCFAKNNNLFWGVGGTDAQNAISSLNNNKERVWCL